MTDAKVLVVGKSGQVGQALLLQMGSQAIGLGRDEFDLSAPELLFQSLDKRFSKSSPKALINTAAYTLVDRAEQEKDRARLINGVAPGVLAKWCASRGIPFIHYSTDYVFDGSGQRPWVEEDQTNPISAYGASKLAGEQAVAREGQDWMIFRTSWVFSATGQNFVRTMLNLAKSKDEISVVDDQFGAPNYAPFIASATIEALKSATAQSDFPSGIYHLSSPGETTWYRFAQKIFETARARGAALKLSRVNPISTKDYPSPARRPLNSRLSTAKVQNVLDIKMPSWEDGLKACMKEMS